MCHRTDSLDDWQGVCFSQTKMNSFNVTVLHCHIPMWSCPMPPPPVFCVCVNTVGVKDMCTVTSNTVLFFPLIVLSQFPNNQIMLFFVWLKNYRLRVSQWVVTSLSLCVGNIIRILSRASFVFLPRLKTVSDHSCQLFWQESSFNPQNITCPSSPLLAKFKPKVHKYQIYITGAHWLALAEVLNQWDNLFQNAFLDVVTLETWHKVNI